MLSLFVLEDYNFLYSNIPSNKVKVSVFVDVVLGCLFSLVLAIVSLLALLLAACLSGYYYYKCYRTSAQELIFHGNNLNRKFVINKLLEIGLLLIPCFGFLGLFFFKVHTYNNNSFLERGLYVNASVTCLPTEIFNARLGPSNSSVTI